MPGKEFYRWQVRSFTVLLALDAVDRIGEALRQPRINTAEEQGGLLFGRCLDDNTIEVTDFELVRSGHRRGISYDLSPHERSRLGLRVQVLSRRKGPKPVGYFRTHLRPGLFLDQSDVALMTETFDESGITLAIRINQRGPAEAGIFFRENDDIDGRQPGLKFPFDAETLRVQGPIEGEEWVAASDDAAAESYRWSISGKTAVSAGAYAVAGTILALATITGLHVRDRKPYAANVSPILSTAAPGSAVSGELETLAAPPALFTNDDPLNSDNAENAASATGRSPFGSTSIEGSQPQSAGEATEDAPPFREEVTPAVEHPALSPPADPLPLAPPATALISANLPAVSAAAIPELTATAPPARTAVSVDVSVEPREDGAIKRAARRVPEAMGHVPLLGRLPGLRHDRDEDVVAAKPYEDLSPRIPAEVSRSLAEQVEVDVDASIDDQGAVRNTEVVRGDDAQLSALAQNAVRASRWKPARSGDRNVATNVVVHYRFSPGREP